MFINLRSDIFAIEKKLGIICVSFFFLSINSYRITIKNNIDIIMYKIEFLSKFKSYK